MKKRKKIGMFSNGADIKRAAIYCRVSTIMQGEAEYSSLNAQEDQLKAYCKGKGWEVVKVYKDIKSGKDLDRDEIQQLLKDAEEKLFDIVVATKIDRFSRSIVDFYEFSEKLNELDVALASATQPIDTSNSAGQLMLDIFLAFAQFERNIISERTKEGMNARAIKGFYTGGHLILGYDNVKGELKINETEAELVNRVFLYYLQEPSTTRVANRLNEDGFRTKSLTTRAGIRRGGKSYTKQDILRILRNKTYLGKIPWKDQVYDGIHEAVIEQKTFDAVQKRLGESKKDIQVIRRTKSPLSLLGITKCGLCGSYLTSQSAKSGKHYYYKCSKKIHGGAAQCPSKDLPADVLENCIYNLMESILSEGEFFDAIYNQIKFNNQEVIENLDKDLKDARTNKTAEETKRTNLLNAIKAGDKLGAIKEVADELERIEKQIGLQVFQINNFEKERELVATQKIGKEILREILLDYVKIYPTLSSEDKTRFNQLLFQEIISNFNQNEEDGIIIIKLRGDGKLEKSWNKIKNANQLTLVRTSDGLGSASKTRTCNPSVNSRMLHH